MTAADHLVIAVDGPSAAGKGTLARRLAGHYRLAFLDSGMLYRAVGLLLIRQGIDPTNETAAAEAAGRFRPSLLQEAGLRDEATGEMASRVAAIPAVRQALLHWQREFADDPPGGARGAVIDGRDIGTVVCPNATAKIFVTASQQARAQRRVKELQERGEGAIYARVLQDMIARDARDQSRATSPLRAAPDALVIDTSGLSADQVFDRAKAFIDLRRRA
jgi:cytidylate kinase